MSDSQPDMAIIGAGPAGLSLALCLHEAGIPCTVYEKRGEHDVPGYSFVMMPNSLRILDRLGVYEMCKHQGHLYETFTVRSEKNVVLQSVRASSVERHGYPCLRIMRKYLGDDLRETVKKREIPVHYNNGFSRVVTEQGADGKVEFELKDGSRHGASLLVGADGIYSTVRESVVAGVEVKFTGTMAVAARLPASKIHYPKPEGDGDYSLPAMLQGKRPAFLFIPEDAHESSTMVFTHVFNQPDLGHAGFEALNEDKAKLKELLRAHAGYWGEPVKSALESLDSAYDIFIWAYSGIDPMREWMSVSGKVIVLGDAAHAMIPSSGQGVNQSIEDGFTLSILLKHAFGFSAQIKLPDALEFWQRKRQARIDLVQKLALEQNQTRLPEAERKKIPGLEKLGRLEERLDWLLSTDVGKEMEDWVAERSSTADDYARVSS